MINEASPHVLVVLYHFPPYGSPGFSARSVQMLKRLAGRGLCYTVLTVDPERVVQRLATNCVPFVAEIPQCVRLIRVPAPVRWQMDPGRTRDSPRNSFALGLAESLWAARARRWARRLHREQTVDLVYVSAPLFSLLPLARRIREDFGVPLLVDLRDDWVGGLLYSERPAWLKLLYRRLEKQAITAASRVVVVTEDSIGRYRRRYPEQQHKFELIPNGYDEELFDRAGPPESDPAAAFTILTAGGFDSRTRSPRSFLRALSRWIERRPAARSRVRVRFLGDDLRRICPEPFLKDLDLETVIEESGTQYGVDYVRELRAADLLLCITTAGAPSAVPGKLYEFWAACGPTILALDDGAGAVRDLIVEQKLGRCIERGDQAGIVEALDAAWSAWASGTPQRLAADPPREFTRSHGAERMLSLIQEIVHNDPRSARLASDDS